MQKKIIRANVSAMGEIGDADGEDSDTFRGNVSLIAVIVQTCLYGNFAAAGRRSPCKAAGSPRFIRCNLAHPSRRAPIKSVFNRPWH